MEGHMHEHGPLYTSVPSVMFDVGGVGGLRFAETHCRALLSASWRRSSLRPLLKFPRRAEEL